MRKNNTTWNFITSGTDGDATLFGVNIFDYEWHNTGKNVKVRDPRYKQEFVFPIYTVQIENKKYRFACGEFSNSVYGFYTRD